MKNLPTAVAVTLIVMGACLLAIPAIFEMVVAGQESYVVAHSPDRILTPREFGEVSRYAYIVAGLVMIGLGVKCTAARTPSAPPT